MTTPSRLDVRTWQIVVQSVAVALAGYLVAGAAEVSIIRAFRPTEWELAWISDMLLASALGVAVYLWRHLSATRQALLDRERAEIVLNTQLAMAADLQRRLLPAPPADDARVAWAAALRSAGQIGGDFYDMVPLAEGRTMLFVADVSGKGIPAAMALSTLRAAFRSLARREDRPSVVASRLSSALYEQWSGIPYLTCIVARIDLAAGTLTYANAAHPSGLVIGPAGTRRLEPLGPPAAIFSDTEYDERTIAIGPGDYCVLVSDGVTEALGDGADGRVEAAVRLVQTTSGSAAAVCDAVMDAALRGRGPAGVADWDDDRTVVVVALLHVAPTPADLTAGAGALGAAS